MTTKGIVEDNATAVEIEEDDMGTEKIEEIVEDNCLAQVSDDKRKESRA